MKHSPVIVKQHLDESIRNLVSLSRLFVLDPNKDFTRQRTFTLKKVVEFLLKMGGNTLNKELLDYFNFSPETVTSSAFIQQRDKLLSDGLSFLFHDFTHSFKELETYRGYRLIAVDGTGCSIPKNKKHPFTYNNKKDMNEIYAVAFYDVCNHIFIDVVLRGVKKKNECRASVLMMERSTISEPTILLGDRGFGSYNNLAHLEQKGWKFLFRTKNPKHNNNTLSASKVPIDEEFDLDINLKLTRSQTAERKKDKGYRFLPKVGTFDFLDQGSKETYPINYRAICIKGESNRNIYFITNLSRDEFPKEEIESLYKERWAIETSFRDLKYTLGLINFHSKKLNSIEQEIYSRLIMYNFSQLIIKNIVVSQDKKMHAYQVNIKVAIHICKENLLKLCLDKPPDIEKLIQKYILPIRNNRHYPRTVKVRSRINLIYRIA